MKNKNLLLALLAGSCAVALSSCGDKCDDEEPRARIANNGTQRASVQVQTTGGNTVNINNIDPGVTSPYASYAPGRVTFTLKVNNVDYAKTTDITRCYDYTIAIDQANVITITGIDRND